MVASIRKSARGGDYEDAIQWLVDAGLIHKSYLVETLKFPVNAYANHHMFKIFLLDVGLLCAQSHLSPKTILEGDLLFVEFKKAFTENFVTQERIARAHSELYYWASEGVAEVDFLVEEEHGITPLKVKAGVSPKKKRLLVYGQKYAPARLVRTTAMNANATER